MISGLSIRVVATAPGVREFRAGLANLNEQEVLDQSVHDVVIDSRLVKKGSLFVALKGERSDGHTFIPQARESGAVAAIVEKFIEDALPQIRVQSSEQMLGQIAKQVRAKFSGKVIAITGSSGKTSVKNMAAYLLRVAATTIATRGNRNNEIGVPLSIFDLEDDAQFLVLEMGAAVQGDIAYLVAFAQPDVALVNNVGLAHVGRFGSIEKTAKAKAEIYSGLQSAGTAVVNLDDRFSAQMLEELHSRESTPKVLTYSCRDHRANICAEKLIVDGDGFFSFLLTVQAAEFLSCDLQLQVESPQPGAHGVSNVLAAIAIGVASGLTADQLQEALLPQNRQLFRGAVSESGGRLSMVSSNDRLDIIDDAYNANPDSMRAAIDYLGTVATAKARRSILILGDMGELGASSESYHAEVGAYAAENAIDMIFSVGVYAAEYSRGFNNSKVASAESFVFDSQDQLMQFFSANYSAYEPAVILVKGSRSSSMETVIDRLVDLASREGSLC